ncbi:uncharacterized protein LOC107807642 [Nicotiana tabacum]|uniref:Uncharacterized protein LOC107807642 n=1 Tax=Nicotiana tabacum TaxID=4097 RepID=A0AC58UHS0_TOBAC
MLSIANVTSSIVKPRITGHFELKQSMIQLLHANGQFIGLPNKDPQQHILIFLEISDTYITNGFTPDYVRLTLFPFSLFGKAKRWLKAEPANSITSWNDLARKFLVRFFPSGKTVKIRIDAAVAGQVLEKSFDEIYVLLNKFSKSNPDWQGEMGRNMVQKSPGVLELDVVSALSVQKLIADQQTFNQKIMADQQAQATTLRNLEHHVGQLAIAQNTRPVGALPSDTEPNPKDQVNAVTLRNGRALEEVPKKKKNIAHPEGELVPKPVEGNEKDDKGPEPVIETRPPPPFSQRLQKQKDNAKYKKFLDILSQVSVNFPLVEILQEVPKYARYLRDIVANKRRHAEFETVALTEECSARVQQLGLGVIRPTTITLQLANRSLVMLEGIIEGVLVRVEKFILPADFIVLDYEADDEVPIILGRPFLATGGAIIDVRVWKLKMRVDNEEITFNVYKLEEVVFPAERVKMIEKRARDEKGDLPRACKKARLHGRKKKRKRPA